MSEIPALERKSPHPSRRASVVSDEDQALDRVMVCVRVRPLNRREIELSSENCVQVAGKNLTLYRPREKNPSSRATASANADNRPQAVSYNFDKVFDSDVQNESVYGSVSALVNHALSGYNCSIFAYGQTGSGKSHTMSGSKSDPGVIPRLCEEIFAHGEEVGMEVEASYLEIYNERLTDLLKPDRKEPLKMRESKAVGVFIEGLTREPVEDYAALRKLLQDGEKSRIVANTKMNEYSSRSHAIFTLRVTITGQTDAGGKRLTSQIHLVDLAGSERQSATDATGIRLKEASSINKSLMQLGKVINILATRKENSAVHVPYRDSQLTRYLQDALGGNSKTIMITTISPAEVNFDETLSTLRYADRAKSIVNKARVNEDPDKKLVRELKEEISRLQEELRNANTMKNTEAAALRAAIHANQVDVENLEMSWKDKIKNAELDLAVREAYWNDQGIASTDSTSALPRLVNLSEDPMMTEKLVYLLRAGKTIVGRRVGLNHSVTLTGNEIIPDIALQGSSVLNEHCHLIHAEDGSVSVVSLPGAHTFLNGQPLDENVPAVLTSGNRIVIGNNHIFRFLNPKAQKGKDALEEVVDWEFAARELAAALGDLQKIKDEAVQQFEKKEEQYIRDRADAENAIARGKQDLEERTQELKREREQREQEARDRAKIEHDHSKLAKTLETIKDEYEKQVSQISTRKDKLEEEFKAKIMALERASEKVRNANKTKDSMLFMLENTMMRVLQGVREANCIIDELNLNLRFDVLTQTVFDMEIDNPYTFITVLLSRTNGGKGSILLEEAELMERFDNIREIYDEFLETNIINFQWDSAANPAAGAAITTPMSPSGPVKKNPFEIIDERELVGWATLTADPNDDYDKRHIVPIVDPISREIHGDLEVTFRFTPPLQALAERMKKKSNKNTHGLDPAPGKPNATLFDDLTASVQPGAAAPDLGCEISLTVHNVQGDVLRNLFDGLLIMRLLGDELIEGKQWLVPETENLELLPLEWKVDRAVAKLTPNMIKYLTYTGVSIELWGVPMVPRFSQRPSTAWTTESFKEKVRSGKGGNSVKPVPALGGGGAGGGAAGSDELERTIASLKEELDEKNQTILSLRKLLSEKQAVITEFEARTAAMELKYRQREKELRQQRSAMSPRESNASGGGGSSSLNSSKEGTKMSRKASSDASSGGDTFMRRTSPTEKTDRSNGGSSATVHPLDSSSADPLSLSSRSQNKCQIS